MQKVKQRIRKKRTDTGKGMEPWQERFIRNNHQDMTPREMAGATGLEYSQVYQYCAHNALPMKIGQMGRPKGIKNKGRVPTEAPPSEVSKKIRKYVTNEEFTNSRNSTGKMVRPEAKYGNRSREDLIDYYLKLEI